MAKREKLWNIRFGNLWNGNVKMILVKNYKLKMELVPSLEECTL